jgi:hypothetical protein
MAYTIRVLRGGHDKREKVYLSLGDRLSRSPFRAVLTLANMTDIIVKPVRFREKKPYCGNHPGPCEILWPGQKKMNATFLEWDDWVKFHKIVNAVLNRLKAHADVWSTPADVRGKMWIRRDMSPRLKYDYTQEPGPRAARVWNTGTLDQFAL